jgi:hypothetical protein
MFQLQFRKQNPLRENCLNEILAARDAVVMATGTRGVPCLTLTLLLRHHTDRRSCRCTERRPIQVHRNRFLGFVFISQLLTFSRLFIDIFTLSSVAAKQLFIAGSNRVPQPLCIRCVVLGYPRRMTSQVMQRRAVDFWRRQLSMRWGKAEEASVWRYYRCLLGLRWD